jgi:peroxiredoxin
MAQKKKTAAKKKKTNVKKSAPKAKAKKVVKSAAKAAPKKTVKKAAPAKKKAPVKAKAAAPAGKQPKIQAAPKEGSVAPAFTLTADDGSQVSLAGLRGKTVVLYFYPKDDTPGCTIEACGFRDAYGEIEAAGGVVLGVSRDTVEKHKKFKAKYNLSFPLLSDPDADVIAAYGSWGPKVFMGRKFDGILRTTVVIGPDGVIKKVFPKVSVKEHADEILAVLKG